MNKNNIQKIINLRKILDDQFYNFKVVHYIDTPNPSVKYNYSTIIASTGKYTYAIDVSLSALNIAEDKIKFCDKVKQTLHYGIEKQIMEDRYKELAHPTIFKVETNNVIIDTVCPIDKTFLVCHPDTYRNMLLEHKRYR